MNKKMNLCHVRTQQEGGHPQAWRRALTQNRIGRHLDLRLPRLHNFEKVNCCCLSSAPYGTLLWQPKKVKTTLINLHTYRDGEAPLPSL